MYCFFNITTFFLNHSYHEERDSGSLRFTVWKLSLFYEKFLWPCTWYGMQIAGFYFCLSQYVRNKKQKSPRKLIKKSTQSHCSRLYMKLHNTAFVNTLAKCPILYSYVRFFQVDDIVNFVHLLYSTLLVSFSFWFFPSSVISLLSLISYCWTLGFVKGLFVLLVPNRHSFSRPYAVCKELESYM